MPTVQTGGGDPARSMALLWSSEGPTRTRGRKPGLTVRGIARAAIELADTEGLDALSMRRVAERLGVGTMSLYTYVPGKAELVDVMLDAVHCETPPETPGGTWRERLQAIAHDQWALARQHPWMLHIATTRPPMGPGILAKYERELRAVEGLGLDDLEMDSVVTLVNDYVAGAARSAIDAFDVRRSSGIDDATWWAATGPWLAKVLDPQRYPVATRVGTTAGQHHQAPSDPHHAFEFGLHRVLDGIAVLVEQRGG
ncbi:MAG: TetR/AcrR family transcriptional regulator [Actinomycetota bacterium]|nr:TetR/AcrR family transcriptional regulator [Actinomycetota bacterium]